MYSTMYFRKPINTSVLQVMNKYFLYTQFIIVKHNNYPGVNDVYINVYNTKFHQLYNIPVEAYTIKFPRNYNFSEDILNSICNKYISLDVTKTIFLDVYSETNEFIGYYSQKIHIHNNSFITDYRY